MGSGMPKKNYFSFLLCMLLALCSHSIWAQGIHGMLHINDGKSVTKDPKGKVHLKIFARGAAQMQISNDPSFIGVPWEAYDTRKLHQLDAREDGLKNIYAKFRDASKTLVSEVVVASIELDREPPQDPSVIINGGTDYTRDEQRRVTLTIYARDAHKMRVSNRSDFLRANWLPYKEVWEGWQLTGGEGLKHVHIQFIDRAGNVSKAVSDTIFLDMSPPKGGRLLINNNDRYTSQAKVTLTIKAEDAAEIRFYPATEELADWVPFKETFEYTLVNPDSTGERIVYAWLRDHVGNTTPLKTPLRDRIYLDVKPPQNPRMLVNSGNRFTNSTSVNLRLSAIGAFEMRVGNDPEFKGCPWRRYDHALPSWALDSDEEGKKTVYAQFRDRAGNLSDICSDDILLDKTAPSECSIEVVSKEGTKNVTRNKEGLIDLKLHAEGARYMMVSNVSSFYEGRWEIYREEYKDWKLGDGDGTKYVFVKFRDKAGNISRVESAKVHLDTEPPLGGRIAVERNNPYTNKKDVQVDLFARGAYEMMLTADGSFEGKEWVKYDKDYALTLPGEDGVKIVMCRFKDYAGNVSDTLADDIILDTQAPYDCSFFINKGDTITNNLDKVVILTPKAREAARMRIGNHANMSGARWQNYQEENITYILPGIDGEKHIYIQFMDSAGNISDILGDTILLDRSPPFVADVRINDGAKGTNNETVTLTLEARGAVEMKIANDYTFKGVEWEPYKDTKEWTLDGTDGVKTVYAIFRDRARAGNISKLAYARIGFDREAPKDGEIRIGRNDKYCTNINRYVTVFLKAKDASKVVLANNAAFDSAVTVPYTHVYDRWQLSYGDGPKEVWVKFTDAVGNETTPIKADIILDTQQPINTDMLINGGDPFTKERHVTLDLQAEGATEMLISYSRNFPSPAKWIPFKERIKWTLTGSDGVKHVYVKFRDDAHNESLSPISARIMLDTKAPAPGIMTINGGDAITSEENVLLSFTASGAEYMMISNSSGFDDGCIWEEFAANKRWVLSAGDGVKRVFVKFKDAVGNETTPVIGVINLNVD